MGSTQITVKYSMWQFWLFNSYQCSRNIRSAPTLTLSLSYIPRLLSIISEGKVPHVPGPNWISFPRSFSYVQRISFNKLLKNSNVRYLNWLAIDWRDRPPDTCRKRNLLTYTCPFTHVDVCSFAIWFEILFFFNFSHVKRTKYNSLEVKKAYA